MPVTINQNVTIPSGRRWGETTVAGSATEVVLASVVSFNESQPTPLSTVAVRIPGTNQVRILVALASEATSQTVVNVNVWQRGGLVTRRPLLDRDCLLTEDAATPEPAAEPVPGDKPTAKKKSAGKKKKK